MVRPAFKWMWLIEAEDAEIFAQCTSMYGLVWCGVFIITYIVFIIPELRGELSIWYSLISLEKMLIGFSGKEKYSENIKLWCISIMSLRIECYSLLYFFTGVL